MHLKRQTIAKEWPIARKGTKFLAVPIHNKKALPVIIALRDILKVGETSKEVKKIIHDKNIKVNGKIIKDEKYPLLIFDTLDFGGQEYVVEFSKSGKYDLKKHGGKNTKICKIIGKRTLKGKKIQINLNDGRNIIFNKEVNTGDSVVFNLKDKKVEKIIILEKGAMIYVIKGKHIGKTGKIKQINKVGGKEIVELDNGLSVWTKNLLAIE